MHSNGRKPTNLSQHSPPIDATFYSFFSRDFPDGLVTTPPTVLDPFVGMSIAYFCPECCPTTWLWSLQRPLTSHKTRQNRVPRESFPILAGCLDVPCAVLPIDHVIPRPQVAT